MANDNINRYTALRINDWDQYDEKNKPVFDYQRHDFATRLSECVWPERGLIPTEKYG